MDEPSCRCRRARRTRERSLGPGAADHEHRLGGEPPHRRDRRHRRPRNRPDQLPWREAADAFEGRIPGRPAGPHLRGVQHVKRFEFS